MRKIMISTIVSALMMFLPLSVASAAGQPKLTYSALNGSITAEADWYYNVNSGDEVNEGAYVFLTFTPDQYYTLQSVTVEEYVAGEDAQVAPRGIPVHPGNVIDITEEVLNYSYDEQYYYEFYMTNKSKFFKAVFVEKIIEFEDDNVKAICVQLWDSNDDGELSEKEAATVTSLGNAFKDNTSIRRFNELRFFKGISTLPDGTFQNCSSLESIEIPSSVRSVGTGLFYGCTSLTSLRVSEGNPTFDSRNNCNAIIEKTTNTLIIGCQNTSIPNSVTSIGNSAFANCSSLTSIRIPNSVTTIGGYAFLSCTGLTNIVIPNSVTTIGDYTFNGCSSLESVEIPNSVNYIGSYQFVGCDELTDIRWTPNAATEATSPIVSSSNCILYLFKESGNSEKVEQLASLFNGQFKAIYVVEGTLELTASRSEERDNDYRYYYYCTYYEPDLGLLITDGQAQAFTVTYDAPSTTLHAVEEDVVYPGNPVIFRSTQSKVTLYLVSNHSGTNTADNDLQGTTEEMTVEQSDNIYVLYNGNFYLTEGTIPAHKTYLDLSSVLTTPERLSFIEDGVDNTDGYMLTYSVSDGTITAATSATTLKSGDMVPKNAYVTLTFTPEPYDTLQSVTLQEYVLGKYAQAAPRGPQVHPGVTDITETVLSSFDGNNYYYRFYQPDKNRHFKVVFTEKIIEFADDNVKAICVQRWDTSGDGELSEKEAAAVTSIGTVFKGKTDIRQFNELRFFTAINTIPNNAFLNCTNLESIKLPQSVISIGTSAFDGCSALRNITMSGSLTSIGNYAFRSSALRNIVIPASVTAIGTEAFYGCSSLTSMSVAEGNTIYDSRDYCDAIIKTSTNTLVFGCRYTMIPETVTAIGAKAFGGLTTLTGITIPASVTSIGDQAFIGCTGLRSIALPASVNSIGYAPFYGCSSMTSMSVAEGNSKYDSRDNCKAIIETSTNTLVAGCKSTTIPTTVATIGRAAFAGQTSMSRIEIPYLVEGIETEAFMNCSNLTKAIIANTITTIGEKAFEGTNLSEITCYITELFTIAENIFTEDAYNNATLYVFRGEKSHYEGISAWNKFQNIIELDDCLLKMTQDEKAILTQAYNDLNGSRWTNKWDLSGMLTEKRLPGVLTADGHVSSVVIPNNNATGSFPYILLQLPALTTLDLSHNHLSGQTDDNSLLGEMSESINKIDISYNQLEGNIGALIAQMDETDMLIANHNNFSELTPALEADTEKSIDLTYQTISGTVSLDINDEPEAFFNALPSILRNGHDNAVSFTLADKNSSPAWKLNINSGDQLQVSPVNGKHIYRETRDFENYCVVSNGLASGSTFKAFLVFDDGDANYDGDVDILDVQTILSYMFNEWPNTQLFNYTAANLFADSRINVQDIVKTVNIIIDTPVDDSAPANRRQANGQEAALNNAYISDGALCLQLTEPITVIDLTIQGASTSQIRSLLPAGEWQCLMKTKGNQTRLVIFSPMCSELPDGTHQLIQTSADEVVVTNIQLANKNVNFVDVDYLESEPTVIASITADDALCKVSGQNLDLMLKNDAKSVQMKVYAPDGRLIDSFSLQNAPAGVHHMGDNIQPGTYIVNVTVTDETGNVRKSTSKVLIQR